MGEKCITSEILVAYSQCPRKAFLLLFSEERGTVHDYPLILQEHRQQNRAGYLEQFRQEYPEAKDYSQRAFKKHEYLLEAELETESLAAVCDVLTKVDAEESSRKVTYQPTIITGTYKVTKEQKTELLFVGTVLGKMQKQLPVAGRIVGMDGKSHRVKLEGQYKDVNRFLKIMQPWLEAEPTEPPALILNQHCQVCQFRQMCREQAEKEDNLSLLARMTPKQMQKYHKRGIFTVRQLSYLFRPRRNQKKRKNPAPVKHRFELQALAIREQKIYVQELPKIEQQPVELFLDIEGIPDQDFYYLIGLLVCEEGNCTQHSFWADQKSDEKRILNQLLEKIDQYPKSPIFHYGNYEQKAINSLSKKYSIKTEKTLERLINLNPFIYGKVYFPTYSNNLKNIGLFLDFSWSSPKASGLQSIAWRLQWNTTQNTRHKIHLTTYNAEDCHALTLVLSRIRQLKSDTLNFTNLFPQSTLEKGFSTRAEIYKQFSKIINLAYFDYDKRKITLQDEIQSPPPQKPRKKHKAHIAILFDL